LGGHVKVAGIAMAWVTHARAGKLRPLVFLTERRIKAFPDVPTLKELGFNYYLEGASLNGIGGPQGIPEDVLRKLENAIRHAADTPKFKEAGNSFCELYYMDAKEFSKSVQQGFDGGEMIRKISK
jgi:tripartite-type tricarboxylate transporter receptor subunit TctC